MVARLISGDNLSMLFNARELNATSQGKPSKDSSGIGWEASLSSGSSIETSWMISGSSLLFSFVISSY
jgi:hypothetical protein